MEGFGKIQPYFFYFSFRVIFSLCNFDNADGVLASNQVARPYPATAYFGRSPIRAVFTHLSFGFGGKRKMSWPCIITIAMGTDVIVGYSPLQLCLLVDTLRTVSQLSWSICAKCGLLIG